MAVSTSNLSDNFLSRLLVRKDAIKSWLSYTGNRNMAEMRSPASNLTVQLFIHYNDHTYN